MRVSVQILARVHAAAVAILMAAVGSHRSGAQDLLPSEAAATLVREVVYNELHDHEHHGYWRYWIERRVQGGVSVEQQVETSEGPIKRLAMGNGRPLSATAEQQERARLDRLLTSPLEQARERKQYGQDEARIGRIVALLPDAFVYEYDGQEDGCYRLRFHPNPDYPSHSTEARIFHAMSGTLWVDPRYKRLAGLEGHMDENVDFGLGILGRLYKGGWFRLKRVRVSVTDWKTESLEVHLNIRALLLANFTRETSEVRGGFMPVSPGLTLKEGVALLEQPTLQSLPANLVVAMALNR